MIYINKKRRKIKYCYVCKKPITNKLSHAIYCKECGKQKQLEKGRKKK